MIWIAIAGVVISNLAAFAAGGARGWSTGARELALAVEDESDTARAWLDLLRMRKDKLLARIEARNKENKS